MKVASNAKPASPAVRPALNRPPTAEERRRAQRVLLRIPLLVHLAGKANPIHGKTHTVSASGAMIVLAEPLAEGTRITIENAKTQTKVEAKVVRPAQTTAEGALVPVEFLAPSPTFWNIFFPPTIN